MRRGDAILELKQLFERSGYARSPRPLDDPTGHRGYEMRFGIATPEELDRVRFLLDTIEVQYGKPFLKGKMWRLPVYGLENTVRLAWQLRLHGYLEALEEAGIEFR